MIEQLELLSKIILELILLLLNPMILFPVLIIIGINYYKNKKYKEETYYKITNITYSDVRHDVGKYGEYLIYKYLKEFENQGAKFLFNIYVPKKDEETTEIDVLMISNKGLFVFESKNYSGWIFGDETKKYWYQTLPSGYKRSHKEKFYNPVFQNNTHIKYLKSIIVEQIPMYSIITFSERCTLMDIKLNNSKVHIIKRNQAYSLVSTIYNDMSEEYLSTEQIEKIYNVLYPFTQVNSNIKQKHIENINNITGNIVTHKKENSIEEKNTIEVKEEINIEETKKDENDNENNDKKIDKSLNCPLCASKLVLRISKRGINTGKNFYGCSNYPKCKYIKQIENAEDVSKV